jgi:hypothetical protein
VEANIAVAHMAEIWTKAKTSLFGIAYFTLCLLMPVMTKNPLSPDCAANMSGAILAFDCLIGI